LNNRGSVSARRRYKTFTRVSGLIEGAGGEWVGIESPLDPEITWLLAGGHRNETIVELAVEEPDNEQVKNSIEGMIKITMLRRGTPEDIMI